jgi:molybdate transport system permease protein
MINIIQEINFTPFLLSFKLAGITTLILFTISLPFSWYLSQTKSKIKPLLESIVSLPIVLPPSVLGFYLLLLLSKNSPVGEFFYNTFDIQLVFNFTGLVIASCIYSLPFMIQPMQNGFESVNKNIIEASYISGKSKLETIIRVVIPNIKPAIITSIIITFAHTIGEFGVVLMIGGSIPSETKVASVAIYEMVEIMDYSNAHIYSIFMITISFIVLLTVYIFNRKYNKNLGL